MKALSIQQPWAWLIVHGHKPIENRSWTTAYRGPVLLHAGVKVDDAGYWFVQDHFPQLLHVMPSARDIARGGIVGVASLTGVIRYGMTTGMDARYVPWFCGPYGFVLREAKQLPFRPLRGQLGLFEVSDA